jgi:hypothetical protein
MRMWFIVRELQAGSTQPIYLCMEAPGVEA